MCILRRAGLAKKYSEFVFPDKSITFDGKGASTEYKISGHPQVISGFRAHRRFVDKKSSRCTFWHKPLA